LQIVGKKTAGRSRIDSGSDSESTKRKDVVRVELRTLDSVLEDAGLASMDFLSVDVEGMELDVLRRFNFAKYRPKLVSLEDFCENFDKKRFMRRAGYKLVRRVSYNNWYVPKETPASVFSLSTPRELARFIRKDFLSVPFIKVQRLFRKAKKH